MDYLLSKYTLKEVVLWQLFRIFFDQLNYVKILIDQSSKIGIKFIFRE